MGQAMYARLGDRAEQRHQFPEAQSRPEPWEVRPLPAPRLLGRLQMRRNGR